MVAVLMSSNSELSFSPKKKKKKKGNNDEINFLKFFLIPTFFLTVGANNCKNS